jgi:hypothetical protein
MRPRLVGVEMHLPSDSHYFFPTGRLASSLDIKSREVEKRRRRRMRGR